MINLYRVMPEAEFHRLISLIRFGTCYEHLPTTDLAESTHNICSYEYTRMNNITPVKDIENSWKKLAERLFVLCHALKAATIYC